MRNAHTRHLRMVTPYEEAQERRLHPLVTSLWVASGLLVAAHVVWVANGMPWL